MLICVGAVMRPRNNEEGRATLLDYPKSEHLPIDTFSIYYTTAIALVSVGFLTLTAVLTICCSRKAVSLGKNIRTKKM